VHGTVRLINGYGATEATITSTLYEARPDEDTLPIGRAIPNTQAIILDDQLRPVGAGTTGQLYLGGAGLARGISIAAVDCRGIHLESSSSIVAFKTGCIEPVTLPCASRWQP